MNLTKSQGHQKNGILHDHVEKQARTVPVSILRVPSLAQAFLRSVERRKREKATSPVVPCHPIYRYLFLCELVSLHKYRMSHPKS